MFPLHVKSQYVTIVIQPNAYIMDKLIERLTVSRNCLFWPEWHSDWEEIDHIFVEMGIWH